MAKYQIETSGGKYEIETDEPQSGTPPPQAQNPQIGAPEAFGRAAVNNLPMGGQIGAAGTAFMNSEPYQKALADWNAQASSAKSQHPVAYGAGAVAGTVAPLAIPGVGELGIAGNAALGAAYGAGNTDLTNIPQAAKDAAMGAGVGGALGAVGKGLGAAADTIGQYAGRFGENQAIKALGKVPPGMDADSARELARRATQQYGLLDADMGPIGRKETVDAMREAAGEEIGNIRDAASQSGPAMTGQQMADAIREHLSGDYATGGKNFDQAGALERELQNIQNMPQTSPADFAQRVTDINQKAKGKSFTMPTNVDTDVSNSMAHINDAEIANRVPDQAENYAGYKQTLGDMKDLGSIIERGEKRGINQRGGNTAFEAGHKFIEEIGAHKFAAKAGMGVGDALEGASESGIFPKAASASTNGVVSSIMGAIQTNPQSLGKFAAPLMQAAQGGSQGIAATHYILSQRYPEYQKLWNQDAEDRH